MDDGHKWSHFNEEILSELSKVNPSASLISSALLTTLIISSPTGHIESRDTGLIIGNVYGFPVCQAKPWTQ